MRTKILLLLALFLGGGTLAFAQITTGIPTAKEIRTGNRPGAGDFGIYLGATSDIFEGWFQGASVKALPLINFKYMSSDQAEWRLGVELYKDSDKVKGDQYINDQMLLSAQTRDFNAKSRAMLYPGFAWHFSSKNILDVYVGAELPLGWNNSTVKNSTAMPFEENGSQGVEIISTSTTMRSFVVGLGAFVGLQAFIADLPLALGAEFGIASNFDLGAKYKNVYKDSSKEQVYYSKTLDASAAKYEKLNARTGDVGGQVRLTLTYYFK